MKRRYNNILKRSNTEECGSIGDLLTGERVDEAFERLSLIVHRTPLITSETTNRIVGKQVYFKMENQQKTGAFKFRGASFKLMQLSEDQLKKGVITASAGNHAQGLAYASKKLDVKATIVMPEKTPLSKVDATKNYGAEVILVGASFQEAYEASMEIQQQTGATYVHPFDDVDIMAGQGTIALEMLRQEDRIDTIIVPIGGGGLIAGIAVAAKHVNRNIRIIGVQAQSSSAMYDLFYKKKTSEFPQSKTIAEGIDVKKPGKLTSDIINNYVDEILTVSDEQIAASILYMLERNKTLMEGAGAAAIAALLAYSRDIKSRRCGVIVTGGNMDISTIPMIQRLADKTQFPS